MEQVISFYFLAKAINMRLWQKIEKFTIYESY